MSLNYVTLTIDVFDGQGNTPITGTATFTPSVTLTDATDHEIIAQLPVVVPFKSTGSPTVSLLATDNSNALPTGWAWTVTFSNASMPASFSFFLPFSGGASQNLSALSPVSSAVTQFPAWPGTALGDTVYGGASPAGTPTRLAGNTTATKKFLTQTGTGTVSAAPGWNTVAAGDLPTLDQITAPAGAVSLNSQKITNLANGSSAQDAAAFGQFPNFPTAATMGLIAWNYPSVLAINGGSAGTSGVVYLMRIPLYSAAVSVTNVILGVGIAGGTLTSNQCFAGLYDNTGTKIGGTADQSGNWTSTGVKTIALTGGPFAGSWPFVYAVVVSNGTTNPGFVRAAGANIGSGIITLSSSGSSMPFCTNGTGATALPGSLTYSSNSSSNTPFSSWVGLS